MTLVSEAKRETEGPSQMDRLHACEGGEYIAISPVLPLFPELSVRVILI